MPATFTVVVSLHGSNFEMMSHGRPELPLLSHIATPASGARGDLIFFLGSCPPLVLG